MCHLCEMSILFLFNGFEKISFAAFFFFFWLQWPLVSVPFFPGHVFDVHMGCDVILT